jgi:hypothetical protein
MPGERSIPGRRGTEFALTLDEPASVKLTFFECGAATGARGSTFCRHRVGFWSFNAPQDGTYDVLFSGRISPRRRLRPGAYAVILTATNAIGVRSTSHRLLFSVRR